MNLTLDKRDYIAGDVIDDISVDSWLDYITLGERQYWVYGDSSACVSFATLNTIECKLNYYLKHNLIPKHTLNWLTENCYLEEGEFNFSDKYIAKLSNTTSSGNTANNVLNTIVGTETKEAFGLIPESLWTFDMYDRDDVASWEDYMLEIPQELIELGKEFARRVNLTYFRIQRDDFDYYINQSPIMTFTRSCSPQGGVYYICDRAVNHAACIVDLADFGILLDSYERDNTKLGIEKYIRYHAQDYNYYDYGFIFNITFMEEKFVKILKDEDSSAVGFFIPATMPETLKNLALAFGIVIDKLDTQEDWDKIINGTFKLK